MKTMRRLEAVVFFVGLLAVALMSLLFFFMTEARSETFAVTTAEGIKIVKGDTEAVLSPLPKGVDISSPMIVALYEGREKSFVKYEEISDIKMLSLFPPLRERAVKRTEISLKNGEWKPIITIERKLPEKYMLPLYLLLICGVSIFVIAILNGIRGVGTMRLLIFYVAIFASLAGFAAVNRFVSSEMETTGFVMTMIAAVIPLWGGQLAANKPGVNDFTLGGFFGLVSGVCFVLFSLALGHQTKFLIEASGSLLAVLVASFGAALLIRKIRFGKKQRHRIDHRYTL